MWYDMMGPCGSWDGRMGAQLSRFPWYDMIWWDPTSDDRIWCDICRRPKFWRNPKLCRRPKMEGTSDGILNSARDQKWKAIAGIQKSDGGLRWSHTMERPPYGFVHSNRNQTRLDTTTVRSFANVRYLTRFGTFFRKCSTHIAQKPPQRQRPSHVI